MVGWERGGWSADVRICDRGIGRGCDWVFDCGSQIGSGCKFGWNSDCDCGRRRGGRI